MREFISGVKNFLKTADMLLLTLCLIASGFGTLLISSAARPLSGGAGKYVLIQVAAVFLGVILYIVFSLTELETITSFWKWILAFNILFILILVPFGTGLTETGNKSWLRPDFLPFGIQPAEIVKISFVVLMAYHMHALGNRINHVFSIMSLCAHVFMMMGLILVVSRDLGVSLMYLAAFAFMTTVSGIKLRWYGVAAAVIAATTPLVWSFVFSDNQKARILAIIQPDPLGAGWHAARSMVTIGGGKVFGAGLYKGLQTQLSDFLPNKHTDFIFAVAGEELGLVGCTAIILLLLAIIGRCLFVAAQAKDSCGTLVCVGMAGVLIFQTFENIGMCIGLTPVIGITLPFFSYGGSSILSLYAAMGLVSGVHMRPMPSWLKDR